MLHDITLSDKSWIASVPHLGQMLGAPLAGIIANKIGRKKCLYLFSIPLICGWLALIFAHDSVPLAIVARILQGFGILPSIGQVYLSEILDKQRRETLGVVLTLSIALGITVTYVLGTFFHWTTVAWICASFVIVQAMALYHVPESPQWLMSHGWHQEAEDSLKKLRGPNHDILEEINALKRLSAKATKEQEIVSIWQEFLKPESFKPLTILFVLWLFHQFSGNYAVVFYAVDIFEGIGKMDNHMTGHMSKTSYVSAIAVGSLRVVGTIFGILFLHFKFSRRVLMTTSAFGMFLSMVALSTVESFKSHLESQTTLSALLIVSSSSYLLFHAIGFNIIPMLLVGELCPVKLKSVTSGLTLAWVATMAFIVVKVFPISMAFIGATTTYGFFAAICLLATIFSFFFVPETSGKSVEDLQNMYAKK